MKKILVAFAAFALITLNLAAQTFSSGSGTSADPYQITSRADLEAIPSMSTHHFILMNNIDMAAETTSADSAFAPISYFGGVFDGNHKTISNLYINKTNEVWDDGDGFFDCLEGTVVNLTLTNIDVASFYYVGGMAGYNYGKIINCHVSGTVTGKEYVGELIGCNCGLAIECSATGEVNGNHHVGGLVGGNISSSITACYTTSVVTAQNSAAGGLVGQNASAITNCYSTGTVSMSTYSGGLVGDNLGTVINSYFDVTKNPSFSDDVGITPLTTDEMQTQVFVDSLNMNLLPDSPFKLANPATNNGYPILYWQALKLDPVPGSTPNYLTIGNTIDIHVDSFGVIDFKKSKPYAEYIPPFPGKNIKPKKLAAKFSKAKDNLSGVATIKGSIPLWNKKVFNTIRKGNSDMYSYDILEQNPNIQKDSWLVQMKLKGSDSVMDFYVRPPVTSSNGGFISIGKDSYFVTLTGYVHDKSKAKIEFTSKGKIKSVAAPMIFGKKLDKLIAQSVELEAAINDLSNYIDGNLTEVSVFKINPALIENMKHGTVALDEWFDLVIDNKFGLGIASLNNFSPIVL